MINPLPSQYTESMILAALSRKTFAGFVTRDTNLVRMDDFFIPLDGRSFPAESSIFSGGNINLSKTETDQQIGLRISTLDNYPDRNFSGFSALFAPIGVSGSGVENGSLWVEFK